MGTRIDIREIDESPVKEIVFSDGSFIYQDESHKDMNVVIIEDSSGECVTVSTYDVDNLIKALKKAKEFGWCK